MERQDGATRRGVYGTAFVTLVAILPVVLTFIIGWLISSLIMDKLELPEAVPLAVRVTFLCAVSFAAIRHLLSEGRITGIETLRGADTDQLVTFTMLGILLATLLRLLRHAVIAYAGSEGAMQSMISALVPLVMSLALVGTIFPAMVDQGDTSIGAALARRSFWPTIWRMSNAMMICFLALTAMVMVLAVVGNAGEPGFLLAGIGFGAVVCYGTILLSVILTWAYRGYFGQGNDP